MPARLLGLLQSKDLVSTYAIVPALARLSERDNGVAKAYLCDPAVPYISKIKGIRGEGNDFCGYRNIQMIVNGILDTKATGFEGFPNGVPSILELQDLIEKAWDAGINADGRVQTGGIRGTRKHIGTPEVRTRAAPRDISLIITSSICLTRRSYPWFLSRIANVLYPGSSAFPQSQYPLPS